MMYGGLPSNIQQEIDALGCGLGNDWEQNYVNEKKKIDELENSLSEGREEAVPIMKSELPKAIKINAGEKKQQVKEPLNYVQKLQQKKNALRKELNKKGILKETGNNEYDHYSYFSESQYKKLATELFSSHLLELKVYVENVEDIAGTNGQPNGRRVKMLFELYDVETGYSEKTIIYGEGIDKGDKALYKAYTGAIKYYLANTFLIATGNEPENDGPGGLTTKELQSFILEYMKAKGKVASKQEEQIKKLSLKQITELVRNSIIKNNQNGGSINA